MGSPSVGLCMKMHRSSVIVGRPSFIICHSIACCVWF